MTESIQVEKHKTSEMMERNTVSKVTVSKFLTAFSINITFANWLYG
jgi:hypothetical protein